ncbi:hypothetical protein GUJ93_ZPchr0006g42517 [Zizania palustris]|uniref:Uncharacterized protein n=1 Tax=Zizania palustris TaxID=103762 RepID=A0A8J5SK31_ZIZPA|nr:hypothetical protein GUJ93_ZPchr0006g42517 [Zizania palustris]
MSRSLGIPVKLMHEAAGHVVTVELKTGDVYRGSMLECEDNWNCQLENITFTAKDGKVSQLEHVFIRGSRVRFMIIPDMLKNAPMFKRLEARIRGKGSAIGVGRGRAVAMRARAAAGRGGGPVGRGENFAPKSKFANGSLRSTTEKLRDTCAANAMEKEASEEAIPPPQPVDFTVATPLPASDLNQKAARKPTRQWAAWTRQEEQNFFNALRQVGKNFEKITLRVQSKNKDQVRHYYYRLVRRMKKLLGPEFSLDAKNSKDTIAAMLRCSNLSQPPAHNNLVSKKPCSVSMGSSDGMKELIEKLAAKIDDLKTSLDKLAPLAPVADQLATLPSKVVALQSSAFENQEQVRALNLALLCAENVQREGKAHAEDNGDTTGDDSINRSRQGLVPPPENDRPPPRDRFRQLSPEHGRGQYDEEEDFPTADSTLAFAWSFRPSTGRRTPYHG